MHCNGLWKAESHTIELTDAETPFSGSCHDFANILSNTFSHSMKASCSAPALLNHGDLSDEQASQEGD